MKAKNGHHQPTGEYPMAYGWIIDKDHIADGEAEPGTLLNAVGLVGPRDIAHEIETRLKAGEGEPFRLYDDDGELYRSEEHTSELPSLMRISYAVFCLKKKKNTKRHQDKTSER